MANQATAHIEIFDRTVVQTQAWLDEILIETGLRERHYALQALRAVLHAVRDELSVEQNAALAAQFPTLLRGLYFEGWVPNVTVRHGSREEFLRKIDRAFESYSEPFDLERIITGVLGILERRHTEECRKLRATLPRYLREFWP